MTKFEAYYEGNNGSKRENVYSSALKVLRGTLSAGHWVGILYNVN